MATSPGARGRQRQAIQAVYNFGLVCLDHARHHHWTRRRPPNDPPTNQPTDLTPLYPVKAGKAVAPPKGRTSAQIENYIFVVISSSTGGRRGQPPASFTRASHPKAARPKTAD
jgi:hypothetical protein